MRTKLGGFSTKTLRQHLDTIDNDPAYSYYADIIRAYLSMSAEEVAKYQQDERSQVAIAACCNPLADLTLLSEKLNNFALVAALNPSINLQIVTSLQKFEHPAISTFLSANSVADPEIRAFTALAYEQLTDIDGEVVNSWYGYSLDMYEESPSQGIVEILQLLTLEVLGFYGANGEWQFWEMLENVDYELEDKLWKVLGQLPRVAGKIYGEDHSVGVAVNSHIAREIAAGMALPDELLVELSHDDTRFNFDGDMWFRGRSPRASVAFNAHTPSDLLSQIIAKEVENIESNKEYYEAESMGVLWRVAGNSSLKTSHIKLLQEFVSRNIFRCSKDDSGFAGNLFKYEVLSMLEGGAFVDVSLLSNPALPAEFRSEFESLIIEIKAVK